VTPDLRRFLPTLAASARRRGLLLCAAALPAGDLNHVPDADVIHRPDPDIAAPAAERRTPSGLEDAIRLRYAVPLLAPGSDPPVELELDLELDLDLAPPGS
jgi:hypothetical protein